MAQTKKRRRRKHRGTQGGGIATKPRGRPQNKAEARARAQARNKGRQKDAKAPAQRGLQPPTWRGALFKGSLAALVFFALIAVAFGRPATAAAPLALFMLLFYVPMSFFTDRFFYRRRLREAEQERLAKAARRTGGGSGKSAEGE